MSRMLETIKPKADQLNSDDMIGAKSDMIIKITNVEFTQGDQPVSIHYEGGNGRPWKPCLSMRRILFDVWGGEENYPGRSISLFRDQRVSFGDQREIGGIRIRAMTDIDGEKVIQLTATRGKKVKYTVRRLILQGASEQQNSVMVMRLDVGATTQKEPAPGYTQEEAIRAATYQAKRGTEAFRVWFNTDQGKDVRASGALTDEVMIDIKKACADADAARDADPFGLPPIEPAQSIDADIAAQIAAEIAARDRMEGQE